MSPKSKEQIKVLKDIKKRQILDASLELFARKGFHATTVEEIAKKAEISKGLVYNYFKSKEEILQSICYEAYDNFQKLFDPDKDGVLTPEECEFFLNSFLELISSKTTYWRLFYSLSLQPEVMELFNTDFYQEVADKSIFILSQYLKKCGFKNPEVEANILHFIFDGMNINYLTNPSLVNIEQFKSYLMEKYILPFKNKNFYEK